MKFSAILSSAAVAAAAVINKRDVQWSVSDFAAGCIPHSTQCSVGFNVLQPNSMETTGVKCDVRVASIPGAGGPSMIPNISGAKCSNSSRTFDLFRGVEGLTLTVSQQVSQLSFRTGSHVLPSDDFKLTYEPNAWVESYTGASSFDLE
ncbi:hypersensitive response-inducing protein [Colletotrichum sublineola]|uniref:Putative hypersensitive response-inducing protein n=1 Tax=Colletotrichum sublineola TaxID=1173701 RepID=A0A066WT19_COLSU|nr:hypersensitive response-inducing protein [Colletotrichum sublineola]KDN59777.1 putative hypersensitive response-inducing protein [Colletotrichum sublineola]